VLIRLLDQQREQLAAIAQSDETASSRLQEMIGLPVDACLQLTGQTPVSSRRGWWSLARFSTLMKRLRNHERRFKPNRSRDWLLRQCAIGLGHIALTTLLAESGYAVDSASIGAPGGRSDGTETAALSRQNQKRDFVVHGWRPRANSRCSITSPHSNDSTERCHTRFARRVSGGVHQSEFQTTRPTIQVRPTRVIRYRGQ